MDRIETRRLVIRSFTPEDAADLFEYLSDEEVVKFEPYGPFSFEKSVAEAQRRSHNPDFWAVCMKESGKLIGNLYFARQPPNEFLTWELGYVFNRNYQGNGYATESCRALMEVAFSELQVRRFVAMCNPLNTPSWKLLERLGFRREGHLIKNIYFKLDSTGKPIWQDTYEYAILMEGEN